MIATEETNITEIELLPDGRICVFGTSLEVLRVLDDLQAGSDEILRRRVFAGGGALPANQPAAHEAILHDA